MHKLDGFQNIPQAFYDIANATPSKEVYRQAQAGGAEDEPREWLSRSYEEVRARVNAFAHFLSSKGVGKGDKVAIISNSRPEWIELDLATLAVGGITVSVYQTLPAEHIGYILFDSGAKVVVVENQGQLTKVQELLKNGADIPETPEREAQHATLAFDQLISIEETKGDDSVVSLEEILKEGNNEDYPFVNAARDDLASLVYTSGTTGAPKGVMQTHGNHLANCRQSLNAGLLNDDSSILCFLPLAHSFAKLMGMLGALTPASLMFVAIADKENGTLSPVSVTKDIREAGATVIPIVPRLLEKMQEGILQKAKIAKGVMGFLLRTTLKYAERAQEAKKNGKEPSGFDGIVYGITKPIREKIAAQLFGTELIFCVSGGAKLNTDVAHFFDMLEIEILEGYGLTETSVATNINRLGQKKIGSVGPVLDDDIELNIAEDGEVSFRGPNIAVGYYGRDQATKEAFTEDGWFHTGDLGEVDDEGFLTLVGRKKELIVTTQGKNVPTELVENVLKKSPYISQVVLLGDNRPYCTALITVVEAQIEDWMKKSGITSEDPLHSVVEVQTLIQSELAKYGAELAKYERPRHFAILKEEMTVDNDLLTPTFKVKRKVVAQRFSEEIESLYSRS